MKQFRAIFLCLLFILFVLPSSVAKAHLIDSANIDQYTRLVVGKKSIQIHYILNMGDFPAYLERRAIDTNVDAQLSPEEQQTYLNRKIPELLARLSLQVDGSPAALKLVRQDLSFPALTIPDVEGQLITMQLVLDLEAPLAQVPASIEYHNDNFTDGTGWREIVVRAGDDLTLGDTAPQTDLSNGLQSYPVSMKTTLLDVRAVSFRVAEGGAAPKSTPAAAGAVVSAGSARAQNADPFAGLISVPTLTPQWMFFSLLFSLVLGAGHALTPGHGKAIVGAYLVGNRGRAKDAILLGLTTTITHTSSVFVLGFATMLLSNYVLPEHLFPWLELLSGVLVVLIGVKMFWQRLLDFSHFGTNDDHDHHHAHDHEHGPHTHTHEPQPITLRGLLALGVSGGLLPCPSALVVMLGAIALHRIAFGMLLIVAFSIGLAGVLTGIGLLLVYARRIFERIPGDGRLIRGVSVVSAAVVTVAGLVISVGALAQIGIFRLASLNWPPFYF